MQLFASDDDGRSWQNRGPMTPPGQHPAHLLRLADGRILLLRCTPSDVAGCRQAVIACDGSVGRSVPSAPYVWNIGMG